jgi:hypothetical protein
MVTGKPACPILAKSFGDVAVSGALVPAHPNLVAAASFLDSSEFWHKFVKADFRVL